MIQFRQFVLGLMRSDYFRRVTSVLIIFFIAATIQAQTLIPELSFKNPVLKTGKGCVGDGLDGAVYIFENVGWGVDALVTILGRSSNKVILANADIRGPEQDNKNGTGDDDAWQPGIKYGNGEAPARQEWWMEFKISFVKHADNQQSVEVNQFFVLGLDIDGDGKELHEFQTYYRIKSFSLERRSAIYTSSIRGSGLDPLLNGRRFDGSVKNYPGIEINAEDAMVSNLYTDASSLIVRLGAKTGSSGSQAASRMYGLFFRSMTFDIPKIQVEAVQHLVASNYTYIGTLKTE
jgi:hypothetical protein